MKKETKKAPTIRFRGFTDDWEQRKLGQFFFTATEKNDDGEYSQADILAASLGTELEKKHIFFGLRSTAESVKKYRKVQLGDIVYTKSPIKHYPNGIFRTCKKIPGIVPSMYCVYHKRGNIKINTSIVQCFFENKYRLDNYLRPLVNVGARNNVNITDEEALKGTITIPINIEEQTQIVDLIENLNSLIALHQRKLDQLKTLKKYFLQNMFPAKGEKVPRIRFKGFTGDWEQRKVGDICSISTGKSNTQDKIDDGVYPFYVRSPIIEHSNKYLYDEEAVLTVGDGVGTGKVFHYVNGKYDLHQRVYRMYGFSEDVSAKFFYHWFSEKFYNRVMSMTAKTSVDSVRYEMIADMDIQVPSRNEQNEIGSFLFSLDNLITLHQRKLEQLQMMKKFMLQNLFI